MWLKYMYMLKEQCTQKNTLRIFKKPFVNAVTSRFVSFLHNLQNV